MIEKIVSSIVSPWFKVGITIENFKPGLGTPLTMLWGSGGS
jgi:hypothetical protein